MGYRRIAFFLFLILIATAVLALSMGMAAFWDLNIWLYAGIRYGLIAAILGCVAVLYASFREVKANEAQVRSIVSRAADGIVTTNEEGTIETINPAAEAIFGYRQSELEDCGIMVLLSSAYPEEEDGDLWDTLRRNAIGATGAAHEVIGLRKDGSKFFMDLSISAATIKDRTFFVAIIRDVTERKKAQIALNRARDELEVRVDERTADLKQANEQLHAEIIERKRTEAEREMLVNELQNALAEIKTLSGLIPICAACKKVRDDKGFWNQIEVYVRDHSEAEFSHGICPDCAKELYPELNAQDSQDSH